MGMAASQARFLGLTARQTNLQFEGQQINQQRTTLSNQSANCYNSLLAMTVPVPPCTDDFTKLVYTFTPTVSTTATIDQIFANPGNSDYKVIFTEYGSKEGIMESMNRARVAESNEGILAKIDGEGDDVRFVAVESVVDEDSYNQHKPLYYLDGNNDARKATEYVQGETYYIRSFKANGVQLKEVSSDAFQNFANSGLETGDYYEYQLNEVKYYIKRSDLNNLDMINAPLTVYTTGTVTVKEQKHDDHAIVEYDNQARVSAVILRRNDSQVQERYTVTSSTEVDEEAYNNAYNQYVYEQYLYDQKQTEINASIEIIQAEDKNLELRLKQLDTENNAIQTEIEAVSKVLKNNIEGSFKTFNA